MMKNVIAVFAVLLFSIANQSIYAQSGLCTSPTPFYEVDLTGFPDGTAALPNDSRAGLCCDASWPLRCIEVEITLDPAAVGIIFDIEDGAQPTGSMFYQINCGEEIPVGNEICLDGVGPHTLTFCKPGNNQNSFIIRSIPGIGSPEDVDVNIGCDIRLEMAGLIPETITWNDITSGTGQYNDYLSCQSGCDVTYVLPTFPAPEFIDYEVCGTPISNLCQLVADPYCDTVRVYTNLLLDITAAEICDGDSYLLPDGQFVGDSGTYEVVLTSVDGCDSVLTTELTVHPSFFEEQDEVLCDGQTYTLPDGTSVSNSGTYLTNLLTTEGCDSIISTSLVFNPNFSFEFDVEICEGENFTLPDGSVVTDAGTYPILLSTQAGCDSLLTYNLTVNENYFLEVEATICDDENFTLPDGSIVTDPGVYTVSFLSERNCDSTIQTTLTVNPTHLVVEDVIICDDDTYTLPDGQVVNGSGVYITNLISSLGCDSVVRTNLTVNATFFEQVDVEICDNETYELPDGTTVTAGGTYPVTLSSVSGCDSVIETRLTVQPTFNNTVQAEICDNETYTLPDGAQVNAPGSYTSSLITTFGCDSIITTQLTVQPTFFLEEDIAICNGDTYTLPDGRVVNATGSYTSDLTTVNGCDSTIRSNVLVQPTYFEQRVAEICDTDSFILPDGSSVNSSGVYPITLTSVSGCDSTIETTLTVHPSFDISQQAVICDNETYVLPDGNAVNTPGMYVSNLITTEGCDSIVRTELTVNPTYFSSETIEICDGDSYVLPDGTMVNAEGIFTSELLSVSGCDSVINTQVIVNEVNAVSEDASICVGDSYTLPDGTVVTAAGSYSSTLLNQFGCDSVITTSLSLLPILTSTEDVSICSGETYMLPDGTSVSSTGTYSSTVTASFGCDSIITTNLNVIPEFFTDISAEICDGESYSLPDGTNVTTSGIYPITLASAAGCDSTVTTTLDVNPSYFTQLDETICANQTFTLPSGQVVNQPGIYTSQYLTDRGCDSIIVINLAVDPVYATPQNAEICSGETFMLPDGTEVSSAGVYVTPLSSQAGCDSIVQTFLQVNPNYQFTLNPVICEGETYVLPDGTAVTDAGAYTNTFTTSRGCDSVYNIDLTVNPTYFENEAPVICDNETYTLPDGREVSAAGNYTSNLLTVDGCDSIIVTDLLVNPTFAELQEAEICQGDSFTLPDGNAVTAGGTYTSTLNSVDNCDSVITTLLSVNPVFDVQVDAQICSGESFVLPDGSEVSTAGNYAITLASVSGCDSVVTTNLIVGQTYSIDQEAVICEGETYLMPDGSLVSDAGMYANAFLTTLGCDSLITVNLTVNPVYQETAEAAICNGETYTLPDGNVVAQAGSYVSYLMTVDNCDSTILTNLMVHPTYNEQYTMEICEGDTYVLPDGTEVDATGNYSVTLSTVDGCDSIVNTQLIVHPSYSPTNTVEICQGDEFELPDGQNVSESGVYQSVFLTSKGCDSIITTNLTVNPTYILPMEVFNICDGDTFVLPDGGSVQEPGQYVSHLFTNKGCDSILTTRINVYPNYNDVINDTFCEGEFYTLPNNDIVIEPGTYSVSLETERGCDSTFVVNLEVIPTVYEYYTLDFCAGDTYTLPDGTIVSETGTYEITSPNPDTGCSTVAIFDVSFGGLYYPTAITPDGNGENEAFFALKDNDCQVTQYHLRIWDRWGEMVFETYTFNEAWDGTHNNQDGVSDLFAWVVDYKVEGSDELLTQKGGVTLLY